LPPNVRGALSRVSAQRPSLVALITDNALTSLVMLIDSLKMMKKKKENINVHIIPGDDDASKNPAFGL